MRPLSHRSMSNQEKQNNNFLNRMVSPDPSRRSAKTTFTRDPKQIKSFTTQSKPLECFNEDGRQATHCIIDDDEVLKYCEKCAIMLASKGFVVNKFPQMNSNPLFQSINSSKREARKPSNSMNPRLQKVRQLRQKVSQNESLLQEKYQEVTNILVASGDKYSSLIEQVSQYFEKISQIVEYQKYLTYNKILVQRTRSEKQLRQFKDYISETINELKSIEKDLEQNKDVVISVSNEQFGSITANYEEKVHKARQIIVVEPQINLEDNFLLPTIPESLNKLADLVFIGQYNAEHADSQMKYQQRSSAKKMDAPSPYENLNRQKRLAISSLINQDESNQSDQQDNQQSLIEQSHVVSEHSFSNQNPMHRKTFHHEDMSQRHNQLMPNSKEIRLKGNFSLASSINSQTRENSYGYDQNGFEQNDQDDQNRFEQSNFEENFLPFRKSSKPKVKLFRNENICFNSNQFEESLGQYFMVDDSEFSHQTQNQPSETFLLNQ